MYEHKSHPLLPKKQFIQRLLRHGLAGITVIALSLGAGILGYHLTEKLSWLDSLLNASMILGGMGPVSTLQTPAGKMFASFYALFSGILFILVAGILIAPVFHRFLHKLHLESPQKRN